MNRIKTSKENTKKLFQAARAAGPARLEDNEILIDAKDWPQFAVYIDSCWEHFFPDDVIPTWHRV